jgi:hypothetical protein
MNYPALAFAAALAVAAMPAAAHHNCNAGENCPDEIGDVMENHEAAIDALLDRMGGVDPSGSNNQNAMDPADAQSGEGYAGLLDDGAGPRQRPR